MASLIIEEGYGAMCDLIFSILPKILINRGSLNSKALDSGYHEQNFPGFWILQARISQILESRYPYMGRSTSQTFSGLFTHI